MNFSPEEKDLVIGSIKYFQAAILRTLKSNLDSPESAKLASCSGLYNALLFRFLSEVD